MTAGSDQRAQVQQQTLDERYRRIMLYAVFAVTVARLWWLALGQTDLYPDEAQYWLWSRHLAFGYYSKPPLVAWLIAATTAVLGDGTFAVRLAAPLLHFATALVIFELARRLYDARVAAWSAVTYATLPGVSVSAIIISTDAPLLLCWAVTLYAFLRARTQGGRWWIGVGVGFGFGLLAKYAMIYWLLSALIFLLLYRDERRHLRRFAAAMALGFAIYAPNFVWNLAHGFVSYHHTEANASWHGSLVHPESFLEFFASQFAVFGPVLFATLIAGFVLARRALAERRAVFLACFAAPALVLMFIESFLSRAESNWAAPAYVSASVLVVAWLLARGWRNLVLALILLHVTAAAVLLELRPMAVALGYDIPAKYDLLHRLHGWRRLGETVSRILIFHPGTVLLANDREEMAALLYYVAPHPVDYLKWNAEGGVHDQFDLDAKPQRFIGRDFLLVSTTPDIAPIVARFAAAGPIEHITILLGGGAERSYTVRLLHDFKGYGSGASATPAR